MKLKDRWRTVLALLVLGRSNRWIARELGISERSVYNIYKAIGEQIGINNTNQLCYLLGYLRVFDINSGELGDVFEVFRTAKHNAMH